MSKEKIVRKAEDLEQAVRGMNEAMKRAPEKEQEKQLKISEFKKKFPDARYIEPSKRIPTGGIKVEEYEKQRDFLWEYVVGVFESVLVGAKLEFWLTGLPGDDYCLWAIPVNTPVGLPRFVAKHLQSGLGWKEMQPLTSAAADPQSVYAEDIMRPFENYVYKKRGTFHPINSY